MAFVLNVFSWEAGRVLAYPLTPWYISLGSIVLDLPSLSVTLFSLIIFPLGRTMIFQI